MFTVTADILEPIPANSSDLLARAQSGDASAFLEWCRPHESRLLRQAMALCGQHALAEDLTQDTLVDAWRCLHRYNGRCRVFTWLCSILLNRYRNDLRKKRAIPFSCLYRQDHESARDRMDQCPDAGRPPDVAAGHTERDTLLHRCIQRLPNKHRDVIYLRYFSDDSLEGVASALKCSVGTVKSRLFHGLKRLRALLNQEEASSNLTPSEWDP